MKPLPQFFALLRYHLFASPWIWVFPFAFGLQPVILLAATPSWRSLGVVISSVPMIFVGQLMVVSFVFAVEKMFVGNSWLTAQTHQQVQTFSGDFLLTRAIDRSVLFKARTALYWMLVLLPFVILLTVVLWKPALEIEMPLKAPNHADFYLTHLPGAEITKTTKSTQVVTSPYGNVVLAAAMTLAGAAAATFWQTVLYLILRLRFRKVIFWGFFMGGIMTGPFLVRSGSGSSVGILETALVWSMNHLVLSALLVLLLAVASYFFAASRDRELEYP
jgi:hypothetical protein